MPTAQVAPPLEDNLLIKDRAAFDAYVYTPWNEALEELERRQQNPELDEYLATHLPGGVPEIMRGKKNIVLFRHIATPNYEISRFLIAADGFEGFQPLIFEYTKDKFTNRNEWKFSLAKLRFHKGTNKNGEPVVEFKNIVNVNDSNNKPIAEMKTLWGESLVDFHHTLFEKHCAHFKGKVCDLSDWLHDIGPSAKDYYKSFFMLFLKDGILFENFLIDYKEADFTKEIILPALREIQEETGFMPLIVALEPTEIEGDQFWLAHPFHRKGDIDTHEAAHR